MKKLLNTVIIISILGILGMAFGSYLYLNSKPQNLQEVDVSGQLVKSFNDSLINLIKKDPKRALELYELIESSPYLVSQKKAFIKKYYGHDEMSSLISNKQLVRMYLKSQKVKTQIAK